MGSSQDIADDNSQRFSSWLLFSLIHLVEDQPAPAQH